MTMHLISRPSNSLALPDTDNYQNRFEIKSASSPRKYLISQHKTGLWWACSCPGWISHRKCRHLAAIGLPAHQVPLEVKMR